MSQEMFQLIVDLSGGCLIIIQAVCFRILWRIFYPEHDFRVRNAEAAVLTAVNLLLGFWPEAPSGIRYGVSALLILACVFVRRQRRLEKAVFVLLLFYNFHGLGFLTANSLHQYLTELYFDCLDLSSSDYLSEIYKYSACCQMILVFGYGLALWAMVGILRRIVSGSWERNRRDAAVWPALHGIGEMTWQDAAFLSSLNGAGILLARTVMELSMVKTEQGIFVLFDEKRDMIWKVPLIALLLYGGELSAVSIFQKYGELQRERQKHFVERQKMKLLWQRLEEAEDFYGSIRKARHEMKNHMVNLRGLAVAGNYQEAQQYMAKLEETMEALDYQFATGNPVTDVVINDRYRKAAALGIDFQVNFHYGARDGIPVFDMGILLGNLLDNALEACERMEEGRRFVRLSLRRKNHFLLIEVENSFDGIVRWEKKSPVPATRKTGSGLTETEGLQMSRNVSAKKGPEADFQEMEHGIGLTNVEEIAERYLGVMDIKIKENVFQVVVMMQQNDRTESGR
ncbi:MAG: sensor histidine kinase [Lachnospiraceae bacterium]|nr:sensor histidine kinase [Lachnospiraceae bacterium]